MFKETIKQIKTAFDSIIVFTVLTGLIYPLASHRICSIIFSMASKWQFD